MPIERRGFLKAIATTSSLALAARFLEAEEQVARATRNIPAPKIKDISVIECEPQGVRLTVVKITTDQDGLYGYGCATFTQRADLVKLLHEEAAPEYSINSGVAFLHFQVKQDGAARVKPCDGFFSGRATLLRLTTNRDRLEPSRRSKTSASFETGFHSVFKSSRFTR